MNMKIPSYGSGVIGEIKESDRNGMSVVSRDGTDARLIRS